VAETLSSLDRVDVVHDHCGFASLVAACMVDVAPVIHTVHGDIPAEYADFYSALAGRAAFVSISAAQRASMPGLPWLGSVHNAVDIDALTVTPGEKEPYLLCLARITPDKGQHLAIEVARRAGMRLVLAGKVEGIPAATNYFEQFIAPAVDGDRVVHLDNVAGEAKARLLARARALLAPLQWEEPFGLAMVEAMASGTPVIALRRGAAPELVAEGRTGFVVDDTDGMVAAVRSVAGIDPWACAELARERFSPAAMASAYLRVYDQVTRTPRVMADQLDLRGTPASSMGAASG
jgi:glycosyltransferase involved in cell wall biosynthesis